jgi:hypothetical protein
MTEWIPGAEKSPDRLDALVWACTELDLAQWGTAVDADVNLEEDIGYGVEDCRGVYSGRTDFTCDSGSVHARVSSRNEDMLKKFGWLR